MWEHFPFELERLRKGRHVHFYQKIMSKEMELKIFNSMFDCKDFFEGRVVVKFWGLECTTFIATNTSFAINSSKRADAQSSSLAFVCNTHLLGPGIYKGGSFSDNFFNCWTASMWTKFHSRGDFFNNWARQFLYLETFGMKSDM